MVNRNFILLFFFLGFVSNALFAQLNSDTILFIEGKTLVTTVTDIKRAKPNEEGTISHTKKRSTDKIKTISSDDVFSIKRSTGEKMIYVFDTALGNEFTVDEMRLYMLGHRDASKRKNGYVSLAINLIASFGAGATGHFLSPTIPFLVAGVSGLPRAKISEKFVSNMENFKQAPYRMGFEHEVKRKRKIMSLLGGGVGLIGGLVLADHLKKSGNELLK